MRFDHLRYLIFIYFLCLVTFPNYDFMSCLGCRIYLGYSKRGIVSCVTNVDELAGLGLTTTIDNKLVKHQK